MNDAKGATVAFTNDEAHGRGLELTEPVRWPADEDALVEALRNAARLPRPNPAARAAAAEHDVNEQARRVEEILERAARGRRA